MFKRLSDSIDYRLFKRSQRNKLAFRVLMFKVKWNQFLALKKARRKDEIVVLFFLIHESVWKYEGVYRLLEADEQFRPIIIVCPDIKFGREEMFLNINKSFASFQSKGYNVLKSIDEEGKWLNVKKDLNPSVVFFTNPYPLTHPFYSIQNYLNKLTCYVPYNFGNSELMDSFYNLDFHNLLWKHFAESKIHFEYSAQYSRSKGKNVVVTGYPGLDRLIKKKTLQVSEWKQSELIKIIWAPHHSIEQDSELGYSSFLSYAEFIFRILEKYKDKIQIAFKPHPLLKSKLSQLSSWGPVATDHYYERWKVIENGMLVEGDYIDLFLGSDAMIHDSGSFLIEYLYTGKPVLRTNSDRFFVDKLNSFAKRAYDVHYVAGKEEDITGFIENLINKRDSLESARLKFRDEFLFSNGEGNASANIFNYLKSKLKR